MTYEQRPWIIALANQKGGQGKSTITTALAAVIADSSGTVLVADADPQGTVSWLAQIATTPPAYETRSVQRPGE
ncbi:MAG TPA: ParA family protein, partial [Isosphaeraceae bacterium]|nr:ParA family protein [Isosphaeraceae bacterium]